MLRLATLCGLAALLVACGSAPVRSTVYDFGPGLQSPMPHGAARVQPTGQALLLAELEASGALEGQALQYRLAYADAQQLRPYATARWSMPVAQLVRQRLREVLGRSRPVLAPGDIAPAELAVLRIELEEFSQVFDSPQSSAALLRARATLSYPQSAAGKPPSRALAQTVFVIREAAPSPDAAGGAQALALASDGLARQLDRWLQDTLTPMASMAPMTTPHTGH